MGEVIVLRGDAGSLPLPDTSVDLIVTSPPYFGLRSYTDGGEHYDGQIGSEATPREFLEALWRCTREWARVLKPDGSLFVNLGDKYSARVGAGPNETARGAGRNVMPAPKTDVPPKSLFGMPWRYALGCIDDLGLILRAEIVWAKPNGLPESVTDRVRRSHEQVFHFTRQPRYYSAVDEVREAHTGNAHPAGKRAAVMSWESGQGVKHRTGRTDLDQFNPLGKLPGSVWEIPSQPLTVPASLGVDHFAAFPMELPRRIILGWSPAGICTVCGEGRRPVVDKALDLDHMQRRTRAWVMDGSEPQGNRRGINGDGPNGRTVATITGYACACPDASAPVRPAVVLDPFGGTGTTALVASVLGRTGVTVDRSADYCRLAQWRVTDSAERAKAMQVPKPPPVADGQEALFGREAARA